MRTGLGPVPTAQPPPTLLPRGRMLGNKRDPETGRDRAAERQRQRQRETFQSKASIETHCSLREPWALWEPGKNGKPEALPSGTSGLACPCTLLLNLGSLTEPPPKQTIARTLVWAQLVALDCFTSGTFLCLPASRLEVSQGARPRSCSQILPPYSLGAGSKLATVGCAVSAIWLSSCPGREAT